MSTVNKILRKKGSEIHSVHPDQTVYDALKVLADKDIGAILVMDESGMQGIFSERDYARKVTLKGLFSKDIPVKDVMTKEVITVGPDTPIFECMTIMTENKIRHLPVVEDGMLVGLVSIGDVVNYVINSQSETIESMQMYISGLAY